MSAAGTSRLVVRRLTEQDLSGAVAVVSQRLERRRSSTPWPLDLPTPAPDVARSALVPHLSDGNTAAWVALDHGGRIAAVLASTFDHIGPEDPRSTYMPPSLATAAATTCCAMTAADAVAAFPMLLEQMTAEAHRREIDRVSVQVASGDWTTSAVWRSLGLRQDVVMAAAPVRAVLAQPSSRDGAAPVAVRAATPGDVQALTDLALEEHTFHATRTATGTRPDQRRETSRAIAQEAVTRPRQAARQLVACETDAAGPVVGSLDVEVLSTPPDSSARFTFPARYGYVGLTAVTERSRGRGVGGALVREALLWLDDRQVDVVVLHYVVDNPLSLRFWSARGFAPVTELLSAGVST